MRRSASAWPSSACASASAPLCWRRAANTSVESAIKAVHGQDVIVRRRLEQTEKEMRRLQEETALQQAELRAIHASLTMRALAPARAWYERVRGAAR